MNINLKNIIIGLLVGSCLFLQAEPYLGYIYPASLKAGSRDRYIIGGQKLATKELVFDTDKIKIISIERVPNFPRPTREQGIYVKDYIKSLHLKRDKFPELPSEEVRADWKKNLWWEKLDQLNEFALELATEGVYERVNPLQAAPSIADKLIVELEVAEDCPVGEHFVRLNSGQGVSNPQLFLVTKSDSYREEFYVAPYLEKKEVLVNQLPATVNGIIRVGNSVDNWNFELEANQTYSFQLIGRQLKPFIGDGVPGHFQATLTLLDGDDKVMAFVDDYFANPDPILEFTTTKKGVYCLQVRDNLARGREDFVYIVNAFRGKFINPERKIELDRPIENKTTYQNKILNSKNKYAIKSKLMPKVNDVFYFDAQANDKLTIETQSLYDFSLLDTVVEVFDDLNNLIASNDDKKINFNIGKTMRFADSLIYLTIPKSGRYKIIVADRQRNGGDNYAYLLKLQPMQAEFQVYSTKSRLNIPLGEAGSMTFIVNKSANFPSDIKVECADLEIIGSNIIAAEDNQATIKFKPKTNLRNKLHRLKFTATAIINGKTVTQEIIPCDEEMQAFAYNHYIIADDIYVRMVARGAQAKPKK